ncbi:cation:dicarboxylase symporter family transporter [Treponema sp.]
MTQEKGIKYPNPMKVWLKLLIGSLLGLALGFLLPHDNQTLLASLAWTEQLAIRLGRYALVPSLFFSLAVAVYQLRQDDRMWGLVFRTTLIIAGAAVVLVSAGLLVAIVFPPARIPILIEGQKEALSLDIPQGILELFPSNALSVLVNDGSFLLPLCILAFFLGAGLSFDKAYSKSVAALVDSLSRIFYYVASFFSEILGLVMIALGAFWAIRFNGAVKAEVFHDIIILLGISSIVIGFGILPLFLYLLGPKTKPWKQLYGAIGPAIAGAFSGDIHFTLPVLLRHSKENHGVKRRANTVSLALFAAFGRAGSAMVAAVSLIVIIKSYSSLGVTLADLFAIAGGAILVSGLLARHPGDGAYAALAVLCGVYGRGFEAGYLILKPIAFYLIAIGTLLDVLIASLGTYAVGRLCDFQEDKDARHFI